MNKKAEPLTMAMTFSIDDTRFSKINKKNEENNNSISDSDISFTFDFWTDRNSNS